MKLDNKKNGYMTVEASLVMSLVLMVYLFVIRYGLWCYDRLMLEQDMAVILLHCVEAQEIESVWQQEKRGWEEKQYLWVWDREASLEGRAFTIRITGKAQGGKMGNIGVQYEMRNLKPQQWLRGKEKLMGKKEEGIGKN